MDIADASPVVLPSNAPPPAAPASAPSPELIRIAGLEMHRDHVSTHGEFWRSREDVNALLWRYGDENPGLTGWYGCTVPIGGGLEAGGIAKTPEALDAICRAKIEQTRVALLGPVTDMEQWLGECVDRALVAIDTARRESGFDEHEGDYRKLLAFHLRDRLAPTAMFLACAGPFPLAESRERTAKPAFIPSEPPPSLPASADTARILRAFDLALKYPTLEQREQFARRIETINEHEAHQERLASRAREIMTSAGGTLGEAWDQAERELGADAAAAPAIVNVDRAAHDAVTAAPPHFLAYAVGFSSASVCTTLSPDEAAARLNEERPTGISSRWEPAADRVFSDGVTPNGCPCDKGHAAGARHWLFTC